MRMPYFLAALALLAGCGSTATPASKVDAGPPAQSTDVVSDTMMPPADVATDGVNPMAGDAAAVSGKGCTGGADQAFLATLPGDATATANFATLVKNCTLPNVGLPLDMTTLTLIGKCVADGKGVSAGCGACFGVEGHCTFTNCVANDKESQVANCPADPTSTTCVACATKYGCTSAAADCKAGKL